MCLMCIHVLAINVPSAPVFGCVCGGGGGCLSSFVAVRLYLESHEEVNLGRPLAHGIFKVLDLKMKDHGIAPPVWLSV